VASIPACVTETVDQEFPARIEYLAAENRIMKAELNGRLKLSDAVRSACEVAVSCSQNRHVQNRHVVEQRAIRGV